MRKDRNWMLTIIAIVTLLASSSASSQCAIANAEAAAAHAEAQRRLSNVNTTYQNLNPFLQVQDACISAINAIPTIGIPGISSEINSAIRSTCASAVASARNALESGLTQLSSDVGVSTNTALSQAASPLPQPSINTQTQSPSFLATIERLFQ